MIELSWEERRRRQRQGQAETEAGTEAETETEIATGRNLKIAQTVTVLEDDGSNNYVVL